MKWENRDINIAEEANIPKFSKLDDIETPLRHFEFFSNDAIVDVIAGYTKLYCHRKETGTSFEVTNETFHLSYPISIYPFKVNNRNTRTRCEICSKSTKRHQNDANGVVLVSLLLTLNIFHTLFSCFYC